MSAFRTKWIARFLCCCAMAGLSPSLAWQSGKTLAGRRLYVEPFTTKAAPERLREYVVAELSKLSPVSLVSSESGADAILGGGGEIWIKGYRSLNPRSGRRPMELPCMPGISRWS
jgi:hypothetical protein